MAGSDEVRQYVDQLSLTNEFNSDLRKCQRFMWLACCAITPPDDPRYTRLLALVKANVLEGCSEEQLSAGRRVAADVGDRHPSLNVREEAAFRAIRYLLHPRDAGPTDIFEAVWNFVSEVEAAGVPEPTVLSLLRDTYGFGPKTS